MVAGKKKGEKKSREKKISGSNDLKKKKTSGAIFKKRGKIIRELPPNQPAEEKYSTCTTTVFWDCENCKVPQGSTVRFVKQKIYENLRRLGYNGDVSIIARSANVKSVPKSLQEEFYRESDIDYEHLNSTRKNAADVALKTLSKVWRNNNTKKGKKNEGKPFANMMLISGDGGFIDHLRCARLANLKTMLVFEPFKICVDMLEAHVGPAWTWKTFLA